MATQLLVYSHQVVLNDVTYQLTAKLSQDRLACCEWLLAVKPLFDEGLIHFRVLDSKKRHPSWYRYYADYMNRIDELDHTAVRALIDGTIPQAVLEEIGDGDHRIDFERDVALQTVIDAASFLGFERSWPGKVHRLVRSDAELAALNFMLSAAKGPEEGDVLRLLNLLTIAVPSFSQSNIKSLVAVRKSEDSFFELRHHLATVLKDIRIQDPTSQTEVVAARRVVLDACEPLRQKVHNATRRSGALSALRTGTTGFAVSALGGVGGFFVGGSLATALVSAGISKTAESAITLTKAYRDRKRNEAVADLIVSCFPQ